MRSNSGPEGQARAEKEGFMSVKAKKRLRNLGIAVGVLVVILGAGYFLLTPRPLKPPASVSSLEELESYLGELAGYNPDSPPGLSVMVVKNGEIVYENAFGMADGPRGIPATVDTVYNTWSTVKPMTAAAIFQLQEQGLLDIDDPVIDYLPWFEVEYPSETSKTITIRHLLTHSSGLRQNVPELFKWIHFDGDPEWNQTELIRENLHLFSPLSYEPGGPAVYTNVGYMLLVAIIEAVSGETYQQYMIDNIFEPLGMSDTYWTYSDTTVDREAAGANPSIDFLYRLLYFIVSGEQMDRLVRETSGGVVWFNRVYTDSKGPTGPISTVGDMSRFIMAILNEGELDGARILSEESVMTMIYEGHAIPGDTGEAGAYDRYDRMYHGLGWYVVKGDDVEFVAHGGGGPGFGVDMRLYPDRELGMAVIGNGNYLPRREINDLIASLEW
jgi:CubicO group peptidase (beta-lactamase class C family)